MGDLKCTDAALKTVFLLGMHGGSHIHHFKKLGLPPQHKPIAMLVEWEEAIKVLSRELMHHKYYKKIKKSLKELEKKRNRLGTFTSWVATAWEYNFTDFDEFFRKLCKYD